jgi:hypothetical protein
LTAAATSRQQYRQRVDKQEIKLFAIEQDGRKPLALLILPWGGIRSSIRCLWWQVLAMVVSFASDDDVTNFGVTLLL